MDRQRSGMRLFVRLAAIPVGLLLVILVPAVKDCSAKLRTPCSKLVEEDEVKQITGIEPVGTSFSDHDDSCTGNYEDYFHHLLLLVEVQKDSTSEYGASFKKRVKDLELDRDLIGSEAITGLDDEAFLAEVRGKGRYDILLVNRSAQKGFVYFYLYPDSYKAGFSREDAKKLIPLITPRLKLADEYLATRKAY